MTHDRAQLDALKRDRDRLVSEIESAGGAVQGDRVRCPFHDDKHPSGSIHEGQDGSWGFTCHSCGDGQKLTLDVIGVVRRSQGVDFKGAIKHLGITPSNGSGRANGTNNGQAAKEPSKTQEPTAEEIAAAKKQADDAHVRLLADRNALDQLWRERGISKKTVERFGVGIDADRRYWSFPVADTNEKFYATKKHQANATINGPKGLWNPKGRESKQLFPISLDQEGPAWILPGELKALAAIGAGVSAIGITSGEGVHLPEAVLELLIGRSVATVIDQDKVGREWGKRITDQLESAGIDVRLVDVGLSEMQDFGDWIVGQVQGGKSPSAIREALDRAYEQSGPFAKNSIRAIWGKPETWKPVIHVPTGLREFDEAIGGGLRCGGIHMFCGKPGAAKTQLAAQIAVNAAKAGTPTAIISMELSESNLAQLIAAQLTRIPRNRFSMGGLGNQDAKRFQEIQATSSNLPITILDDESWPGGLDRDRLDKIVGRGVQALGWKLVVVDYLGLLAPCESDRSEFETDLRNSSALKRLARKHDIALVVISALRKSSTPKKPADITLDEVTGAGRLTYDSIGVYLVHSERQPRLIGPDWSKSTPRNHVSPQPFTHKTKCSCGGTPDGASSKI